MLRAIMSRRGLVSFKSMFAILIFSGWLFSQPQAQQQRLIDKVSWRTEPVKVVRIKNDRKQIELGKKFSDEGDWLKGLTVTVESVSNKAIARVEIDLAFPRPVGTSEDIPTFVLSMAYGKEPSDNSDAPSQRPITLGERADIKLMDANLPVIKEVLQREGYANEVTHVQVSLNSVTF